MLERQTFYFIDTNIWLYAAGDQPTLQEACLACLEAIRQAESFSVTSVAVLEEVCFLAYRQRRDVALVSRLLERIEQAVGVLLPVTVEDYRLAVRLLQRVRVPLASTKDYFHVACMLNNRIRVIVSSDQDFDRFPAIHRLDPLLAKLP